MRVAGFHIAMAPAGQPGWAVSLPSVLLRTTLTPLSHPLISLVGGSPYAVLEGCFVGAGFPPGSCCMMLTTFLPPSKLTPLMGGPLSSAGLPPTPAHPHSTHLAM